MNCHSVCDFHVMDVAGSRLRTSNEVTVMSHSYLEALNLLKRGREIWSLFEEQNDPPQRVSALAQKLRVLWPGGFMYACVLNDGGQCHGSVLDSAGGPRSEWTRILTTRWCSRADNPNETDVLSGLALHAEGHHFLSSVVPYC